MILLVIWGSIEAIESCSQIERFYDSYYFIWKWSDSPASRVGFFAVLSFCLVMIQFQAESDQAKITAECNSVAQGFAFMWAMQVNQLFCLHCIQYPGIVPFPRVDLWVGFPVAVP